jgi:glutamyl-tRNA synthetase
MRVEDLDAGRVRPGLAEAQLADLAALGLEWDGPVVRQSERMEPYEAALGRLDDAGLLYPCYCTRAEIRQAASAPHGAPPEGAYPGTCRELTTRERAARERAGRPPALRLRADGAVVGFTDRLLGEHRAAVDDFVVRRNDGAPAYNLAVVVDDTAQGIGEVVRGADLLETTPRQLHVRALLGGPGVTHADRAAAGQSPREVRSELAASLGLAAPGEQPTLDELLARFDPDQLPREATVLAA